MASGASAADIRSWAAENGFDVAEQGRLTAEVKDAYDQAHASDTAPASPAGQGPPETPDFTPDPEPDQRARRSAGGNTSAAVRGMRKPVKVTAAVRDDINAKVALMLGIPASAWKARDPWCGQAAVEVVPATSDALTDIFCGSPDVVAFFTTAGGDYMKWLKLMIALQPLGIAYYGHHISHTIGEAERGGPGGNIGGYVPPDMSSFHAPPVP